MQHDSASGLLCTPATGVQVTATVDRGQCYTHKWPQWALKLESNERLYRQYIGETCAAQNRQRQAVIKPH